MIGLFAVLCPAGQTQADTVWVATGGGNPVPFTGVTILRIDQGKIFFRTGTGTETSRPIEQAVRIAVDGNASLNAAEEAVAAGNWQQAVAAYQQTLRAAQQPWLRTWSAMRLADAGQRTGQFDAAVAGYVALVQSDARLALERRPEVPAERSAALDAAATELNRVLSEPRLANPQKQALLSLLLEVQRVRGDTEAAADVAQQMLQLTGGRTDDPAQRRAIADLRLSLARMALDQKQYAKVLEEIEPNGGIFTEPRQQVAALFYLAEARYALAVEQNDAAAVKNAAIDYMRIAAHFGDRRDLSYVPDALLRTAAIHERDLDDPAAALRLYEQIATEYANRPAGAAAQREAERLRAD